MTDRRAETSLKELNQIWAGLRTNARTALTTKIKAAEATAARAAEQTLIANAARTAFTRPGQSLYDFQSRYRKAKDEAEYLDTLETRNLAAWKALRKEYKKHGTLPQATKDAVKGAKDTVRDRLIVVGGMRDFLDDWNDTAMPAPRDDNDEPKILESFLSARRKDAVRNKVAREAAKEGEDDVLPSDEEHRWQAWKSIGEGGNGQAWVWVCFDQDDKIIEVRLGQVPLADTANTAVENGQKRYRLFSTVARHQMVDRRRHQRLQKSCTAGAHMP